jgi:FkbM family methyltransferase
LEEKAVSDSVGDLDFVVATNSANSHLGSLVVRHATVDIVQSCSVSAVTIDQYVETSSSYPDLIKMDIEGAEVLALAGAKSTIANAKTIWIIATHSQKLMTQSKEIFSKHNYNIDTIDGFDHELIAIPKGIIK